MSWLNDDQEDWWAEFKRQEDEAQQLEFELNNIRMEIANMKVTVHDKYTNISGTYLQGSVNTTLDELVQAFGPPLDGDMYKTRAEWVIEFELSTGELIIATIYDWKQYDTELDEVTKWNVGGKDPRAAELVLDYLNYLHDMRAGAHEAARDVA